MEGNRLNNPNKKSKIWEMKCNVLNSDEVDLTANIKDEIKAIAQYEADILRTSDAELKALLEHIKGEEEGHKKELEAYLERRKI